jgi:hypothetical protein
MGALAYAIQALQILPSLISAGVQVKGLIENTNASLATMQKENRDPTAAEWDALNAQIADLRKQLHS